MDTLSTRFGRAAELIEAYGAAAQLCVIRDGEVVLDHSYGCPPDGLFWIFSASKPLTSVLVHRLGIPLDEPVVSYWPEFGSDLGSAKGDITVRHVLQHRTGMPTAGSHLGDAAAMISWKRTRRRIERAAPVGLPGSGPAYQFVIQGFILGEILQRATGLPLRTLMQSELLEPLRMNDTYLGLPRAQWHRRVPVHGRGRLARITATAVNRRPFRSAVIPSAGISTTARDLATFYQGLLDGRVLDDAQLAEATRPTSDDATGRFIQATIRWSQGFQLGGARDGPWPSPFGQLSGPLTYGHNGSNCCMAWADPERRIAYAHLTAHLSSEIPDLTHHTAVADAILQACG